MSECVFVDRVYMEYLFIGVAVVSPVVGVIDDLRVETLCYLRVTVVSDHNTAVRMGHAKLSSCLANRTMQDK